MKSKKTILFCGFSVIWRYYVVNIKLGNEDRRNGPRSWLYCIFKWSLHNIDLKMIFKKNKRLILQLWKDNFLENDLKKTWSVEGFLNSLII